MAIKNPGGPPGTLPPDIVDNPTLPQEYRTMGSVDRKIITPGTPTTLDTILDASQSPSVNVDVVSSITANYKALANLITDPVQRIRVDGSLDNSFTISFDHFLPDVPAGLTSIFQNIRRSRIGSVVQSSKAYLKGSNTEPQPCTSFITGNTVLNQLSTAYVQTVSGIGATVSETTEAFIAASTVEVVSFRWALDATVLTWGPNEDTPPIYQTSTWWLAVRVKLSGTSSIPINTNPTFEFAVDTSPNTWTALSGASDPLLVSSTAFSVSHGASIHPLTFVTSPGGGTPVAGVYSKSTTMRGVAMTPGQETEIRFPIQFVGIGHAFIFRAVSAISGQYAVSLPFFANPWTEIVIIAPI